MPDMKQLLFFLLISLLFSNTSGKERLDYEILIPATTPLPKDVKTILFVARNIQFEADSITKYYKYNGENYLDTTDYQHTIINSVYDGFVEKAQQYYPTDTIRLVSFPKTKITRKQNISLLGWEQIDNQCKKHNADILVCLDYITLFNNYNTWHEDSWVGLADIHSFYEWTIYDPMTQKILLDEKKLDTIQAVERDYSLEYLLMKKMPKRNEIFDIVSFSIGKEMANTITPNWTKVSRVYFDNGTPEMRKANLWIKQQKWNYAIDQYEKVIKNDKHKARAQYNIAVMYERLGQINKALQAIDKSINIYNKIPKLAKEKQDASVYKALLQKFYKKIQKEQKEDAPIINL